jgi:hypothetical protein
MYDRLKALLTNTTERDLGVKSPSSITDDLKEGRL